ncbi:radical SAM/SPASM domain-containing protein [Enterococcus rivorum]|nr:radical SAM protein [Enterococcus rivorum]
MKLFEYSGAWIVGNKETGVFAGVDTDTKIFIEKVMHGETIKTEEIEKNKEILQFLEEQELIKEDFIVEKIFLDTVYLHVTNDCPLHCIGCYSDDISRNCKINMSLEKICDIIKQLKKLEMKSLVISGGEPLLRKDIVEIVRFAKKEMEIPYVVILTSGVTLNEELSNELAEYLDEISISIDGFSKEVPTFLRDKGIFEKVEQAIIIAKNSNFKRIRVLPTIHKNNIDYIENYNQYAKEQGVGISYSLLTVPPNDVLKDWIPTKNQLKELAKKTTMLGEELQLGVGVDSASLEDYYVTVCEKCGIGEITVSIGTDGSVYPCHMTHLPELKIGNVYNEQLKDIVDRANKNYSKYNVDSNSTCVSCQHKYFCGGGCRARAYMFTKDLSGDDPYCPMFKEFFNSFSKAVTKRVK